jgi:stalled ribosome rescue protein Dom34
MSLHHAIVWIDHHHAEVLRFDADEFQEQRLAEKFRFTRQHGIGGRSEHEFFSDVCDAITGVGSIVVAGSHTAQSDFRHYLSKQRSSLMASIVGWEIIGHPSEKELVMLARHFFMRMSGAPKLVLVV